MLDDATLARLGHLNFQTFFREQALWSDRGRVHEAGGVLLHASGTEFPFVFNAAHRTDVGADPADVIARADAFFGDLGRGFTLYAREGKDDDLRAAALEAGLQEFGGSPEMVCRGRLADVDPPGSVDLRPAATPAGVADFLSVGEHAYPSLGMPPEVMGEAIDRPERLLDPHLLAVVAYDGTTPVAAAQTLLSHGIAGVYWVGTLPDARGRGLGEAVTRWVTNAAFDRGARAQTLQASPMGEAIYARMGYDTLYRYVNLIRS